MAAAKGKRPTKPTAAKAKRSPPAAEMPAAVAGEAVAEAPMAYTSPPTTPLAASPALVPVPATAPDLFSDGVIRIVGARQHNLKNLTVELPRNRLVVITGPSGSGKSSLAFDTLYAEGQRRYVESLSAYARQFLDQMQKPEVDHIEGLSPAIAIEQRSAGGNPRSIVATTTEIYDYLRLLFAHIGKPHCPKCGRPVRGQSPQQICDHLAAQPENRKMMVMAPVVRGKKGEHRDIFERLRKEGFTRARVDGELRNLDDEIKLEKTFAHSIEAVVDRLVTGKLDQSRLNDSVERSLRTGEGVMMVMVEDPASDDGWRTELISEHLACTACGISMGEMLPRNFSFNSPYGACPTCAGLGSYEVLDAALIVDDSKTLKEGAIPIWRTGPRRVIMYNNHVVRCVAEQFSINLDLPFAKMPEKHRQILLHGSGDDEVDFSFRWGGRTHKSTRPFDGIIPILMRRYRESESMLMKERLRKLMTRRICPDCHGARLRPESLAVTVNERGIHEFIAMSVKDAARFVEGLQLNTEEEKIAREILREIKARLSFLNAVGLSYLTLRRESGTLSGGEAQRIRLATQVGSGLVGVMYVLDEPSIGLHQRDNRRLLDTLLRLRHLGNTVIVVEHDQETIEAADYLIDLGPGAGAHGGELVAYGTPAAVRVHPDSLTGQYLSGRRTIPIPERREPGIGQSLRIIGARENNLKNLTVSIPLGTFCGITGVSGSGKSTLINAILVRAALRHFKAGTDLPGAHDRIEGLKHLQKLIVIDQSPIGRTPRSNPATYTGGFDLIRQLFAKVPEARTRGYQPGRFSFNVKGGRCEECGGDGIKKIEMQFLPDIYVICESCKGKRYNRETLLVTYKGRHIAEVLDMTVTEACGFFDAIPKLKRILETLDQVGLGYLKLGQPATTLSGGEAQRVKLATELARPPRGHTLYVLDEPTTGLHMEDVKKLLQVLVALREQGNTVVVIEHNLDVIKVCDYLLDLGPEGGDEGGRLLVAGTPETVAKHALSYTGEHLRPLLAAT